MRDDDSVYCPTFDLNYFRIARAEGRTLVTYHRIAKKSQTKLTPLERFAIVFRKKPGPLDIPSLVTIEP